MVQQHRLALLAIVEGDMERAAEGDDELLQPLMGMAATTLSARHIVDPVGTLYIERHHGLSLSKGQVTTRIGNLRQVNNLDIHWLQTVTLTWRMDQCRGQSWPDAWPCHAGH